MPAKLKPEWLVRLREVDPQADIRFNHLVGRWEFLLSSADGVIRSQFWGRFYTEALDGTRTPVPVDPATGLAPFRDLDDAAIEEACANLERTFVGNRWDGAGSTGKEVIRRQRFNDAHRKAKYRQAGELWADMYLDRLPQIRGTQQVSVAVELVDEHGRTLKQRDAVAAPRTKERVA
jgi:hypothetical protein